MNGTGGSLPRQPLALPRQARPDQAMLRPARLGVARLSIGEYFGSNRSGIILPPDRYLIPVWCTIDPMQERTPMTLRLPDDLRDLLKRLAQEDDRSLHSLIIHALRQYTAQRTSERRPDR